MKKYALNIDADGRILSATFAKYVPDGAVLVDSLPSGNLYEYRYVDGEFIHDPLPVEEEAETELEPSAQDDTDAMMIDHEYRLTLLELGLN